MTILHLPDGAELAIERAGKSVRIRIEYRDLMTAEASYDEWIERFTEAQETGGVVTLVFNVAKPRRRRFLRP
jgi:hypothetical protein